MSFIKSEDLGNDYLASDFDIMKIMRMYGCGMYVWFEKYKTNNIAITKILI